MLAKFDVGQKIEGLEMSKRYCQIEFLCAVTVRVNFYVHTFFMQDTKGMMMYIISPPIMINMLKM